MKEFSGLHGWAIGFDENSNRLLKQKALELAGSSEYVVKHPHITLYHAQMNQVPKDLVTEDVKNLSKKIVGKKMFLKKIIPFGGKFLFWHVENKKELQNLHNFLVDKYCVYLRKEEEASAKKERLELNKQQEENIVKYGHPLVKDLYLPHVTLAYDSAGIEIEREENLEVVVNRLMFVEVGEYGSVNKVLVSTS